MNTRSRLSKRPKMPRKAEVYSLIDANSSRSGHANPMAASQPSQRATSCYPTTKDEQLRIELCDIVAQRSRRTGAEPNLSSRPGQY